MFKKSFKIKSNSRLKTTEKKKLRNELLKEFPTIEKYFTLDALNLKSNISVVDILTHSGDNIKVYTAPLYPSFILYSGRFIPTVYMLWEIPDLIHHFTTYSPVLEKIKNGADLMLPGVVLENECLPNCYGYLKRGDPVGINICENLSTMAVGEAAMSSADMYSSGKRGKCVSVIHFFGDYLSEFAPSIIEAPLRLYSKSSEESVGNDLFDVQETLLELKVNESEETLPRTVIETVLDQTNPEQKTESTKQLVDACSDPEPGQTMEDIVKYCFYKSLVTTVKKTPLPLLTNVFYKNHMINVYPQGSQLDIKKSKYKKLSTFLEEMCELKVISLEQNSNGIHKITGVDFGHETIKQFLRANPVENVVNGDNKKNNKISAPSISETYTINATVLPLFTKYGYKKGDTISQTDVRKIITTYIKDGNLQDHSDKRFVRPDKLIKDVIKKDMNSLTWEDIMSDIVSIMGQSYQVNLPTNKTLSGKGKMPNIEISVATRSGNKKVTLINNLSFYGINLNDFSKECQHGVAASTTINSLAHLKSEQVQVQGNQINFVAKLLLEKYQIPKRFIRGLP